MRGDLVYLVINGNRETNQHRLPTEIFVLQFQRENRGGAECESSTWCRHRGAGAGPSAPSLTRGTAWLKGGTGHLSPAEVSFLEVQRGKEDVPVSLSSPSVLS